MDVCGPGVLYPHYHLELSRTVQEKLREKLRGVSMIKLQAAGFRVQVFGFRFRVQGSGLRGTSGRGESCAELRVVRFGCGLGFVSHNVPIE